MRYYAQYENGKLIAIGTGQGGTELTAVDYYALLDDIRTKAALLNRLYTGKITAADLPKEWKEELLLRAAERAAAEAAQESDSDNAM